MPYKFYRTNPLPSNYSIGNISEILANIAALNDLSAANILTEINKVATCTTNKLTDAVVARIDADISTSIGVPLSMFEIWSAPLTVGITIGAAADATLPDVVIPNLGTYTIEKAYAMFTYSTINNDTGSANATNTDTFIQVDKASAGYINAISMPDSSVSMAANLRARAHFMAVGNIDISSRVANNATTNFKWTSVAANAAILVLGIRCGIRLIVS